MGNGRTDADSGFISKTLRFGITIALAGVMISAEAQITNWTSIPSSPLTGPPMSVAFGNGRYIATLELDYNSFLISDNGRDWSRRLIPYTLTNQPIVRFAGDRFFLLSKPMLSSTDGLNWISYTNAVVPIALAFGNGRYVAVTYASPSIFVSTDATNWTVASATVLKLRDLTFGAGLFVACGDSSIVISSPDGLNWAYASWLYPNNLKSICYGNGRFVLPSYMDGLLTSTDAVNWTHIPYTPSAFGDIPNGRIVWGRGSFISNVGNPTASGCFTSTDATNWVVTDLVTDCTFSTTTCYACSGPGFKESNLLVAPSNAPSKLTITLHPGIEVIGNVGNRYRIEFADGLTQTNWATATEFYLQQNPTLWLDPHPATGNRYYRSVRLD